MVHKLIVEMNGVRMMQMQLMKTDFLLFSVNSLILSNSISKPWEFVKFCAICVKSYLYEL